MHELSIVMNIVDLAEQTVRAHQARKIDSIVLHIGKLAGIEMDALEFVWESGVRGTVLEGAERKIEICPAIGHCLECGLKFEMEFIYDICPECNGYSKEIIAGKELRVKSLIINKN